MRDRVRVAGEEVCARGGRSFELIQHRGGISHTVRQERVQRFRIATHERAADEQTGQQEYPGDDLRTPGAPYGFRQLLERRPVHRPFGRRLGVERRVGTDAERIQVANGVGIVSAFTQPRQAGRMQAVQPSKLTEIVERERADAEAFAAIEQVLEVSTLLG